MMMVMMTLTITFKKCDKNINQTLQSGTGDFDNEDDNYNDYDYHPDEMISLP